MADQVRCIGKDPAHSLADQLSLDACGYRRGLCESKADAAAGRLDNLEELISLASNFHSARELLDHAALAMSRDSEGKSSVCGSCPAPRQGAGVRPRFPAGV